MAKITITVETAFGSITKNFPLSNLDMIRGTNWMWFANPQLNPNGTLKPKSNANVADAVRDWMDGVFTFIKSNVVSYERSKAEQIARDSIGDLDG